MGLVYLIHFQQPLKHAQHYLGYVDKNLEARIKRHKSGDGSKLMRAVNLAGIAWEVVRIWKDVDKHFERTLKNRKNTKCLCPLCNPLKYQNYPLKKPVPIEDQYNGPF